MTTKMMRNPHAMKRADTEEARHAKVKQENEEYYANGSEWKFPRRTTVGGSSRVERNTKS